MFAVAVTVGAVEAANSNTVFHATVRAVPPCANSTDIIAPSTALLGAENVVFSVVTWYAFAAAAASQATALELDVKATCVIFAEVAAVTTPEKDAVAKVVGVISAEPSKLTPPIFLAVVKVAAEPVVSWFSVPTVKSKVLSAS